jgi:general stress protein 26
VFQQFNLLPCQTALENVALLLVYFGGIEAAHCDARAGRFGTRRAGRPARPLAQPLNLFGDRVRSIRTATFGRMERRKRKSMAKKDETLKAIAKLMRELDFCMFTTNSEDGGMYSRPMSNNREVEFDGDLWFFSGLETRKVREIKRDPNIHLSFIDPKQFTFISVAGAVEIVTDKKKKRDLWLKELERWFPDGPDSDDVVLLKVNPTVITYWSGENDGEMTFE